jgi:hypothetical protein
MTETVYSLMQEAIQRTGLADFGDDIFREPLEAWVADLQNPLLNPKGRAFFARAAVNDLCRRADVIDWFNRHPEIEEVAIPPIIYITGHERSGTTLLHNLLSQDRNSRALLRWELMRPTPPPAAETYHIDHRIAEVQAPLAKLRGTLLEKLHWVNADDPEECTWGLLNCTSFLGQAPRFIMPNWDVWLQKADMTPTFLEYRRLIKLLLWRNPVPKNGYLVLKAPQHVKQVSTLARVFPEALFVLTHRDPFRAFTSMYALAAHINTPFIAEDDFFNAGGRSVELSALVCEEKLKSMIETDRVMSNLITNVNYSDLVLNPKNVVRRIHEQLNAISPNDLDDLDDLIDKYLDSQKTGRRARPPSELPSFGIEHQEYLKRESIFSYCQHFQVKPELTRKTGA